MSGITPPSRSLLSRIGAFVALSLGFTLFLMTLVIAISTLTKWIPAVLRSVFLPEIIYEWSVLLLSVLIVLRVLDALQFNLGWKGLGFSTTSAVRAFWQGGLTAFLILAACFTFLLLGGWVKIISANLIPTQ